MIRELYFISLLVFWVDYIFLARFWYPEYIVTAVMNMSGFLKVHDLAICLGFAFVCLQLCVFFPSRGAYSEDLKLSPHEVWLRWWNLSTLIGNSMNRWVSLLSPYSLNLRSGVWYRVFQLKECFNELNKAKFKFWIEHFREKVYWIIFSIEYSWKNDIE